MSDLTDDLRRLAAECQIDDQRAIEPPWSWTDDTLLWNIVLDHCILEHAHGDRPGVGWPTTKEDRDLIANTRNRLPDIIRVMQLAARRIDLLEYIITSRGEVTP